MEPKAQPKRVLLAICYLSRQFFQTILEREEFLVDVVPSAGEAWEKLKAERYDIVLAEVFLQDKYGYDLLDDIRASENLSDIPFVLVEVSRNEVTEGIPPPILSKWGGFRADKNYWVIRMPFDPKQFIWVVKRALQPKSEDKIV